MALLNGISQIAIAIGIVTIVILALATLWPYKGSAHGKRCFLGYRALCPFAPVSTLMTLGFAVFIYWYGFIMR